MPATLTILYPNEPDAKYDVDYYIAKHMPLVVSAFQKYGVTGWSVTRYTGAEPKYFFAGHIQFTNIEDVQKALDSPEAAETMLDVPNYSNKQPVILMGEDAKNVTV